MRVLLLRIFKRVTYFSCNALTVIIISLLLSIFFATQTADAWTTSTTSTTSSSSSIRTYTNRNRRITYQPRLTNYQAKATTCTTTTTSTTSRTAHRIVEISPSDHGTIALKDFQKFDSTLKVALEREGWITPTPIQANAIPLLQKGYDVMASSQTGSGKSLMFCLPMIERIQQQVLSQQQQQQQQQQTNSNTKYPSTPLALIISPTRELAIQTSNVLKSLCQQQQQQQQQDLIPTINICLATGGSNVNLQRQELINKNNNNNNRNNTSCTILVGTPGRILQFTDERTLSLKDIKYLIIDEADRLMDLGFEQQLTRIAKLLSLNNNNNNNQQQQHQSVLCSATFPVSVQRIASDLLRPDYYFVTVGKVGSTHSRIQQSFQWVDNNNNNNNKEQIVTKIIHGFLKRKEEEQQQQQNNNNKKKEKSTTSSSGNSIIVFCNTKQDVETLGKSLSSKTRRGGGRKKVTYRIIHGDKQQSQRNQALKDFQNGLAQVLIATDVAARGLDVSSIGLVIQYDMPKDVDTYTHRVGRTGRAGAKGEAVALFSSRTSIKIAPDIVRLLQEAQQSVPPFLVGMSHLSIAQSILEDEKILAGSGGGNSSPPLNDTGSLVLSVPLEENDIVNSQFTGQDFRRHAAEGSFGAGKDTSYRSFDEEAYSPMTQQGNVNVNSTTTTTTTANKSDENPSTSTSSIISLKTESFQNDPSSTSSIMLSTSKPSRDLLEIIANVTGKKSLGKPKQKVLSKLMKSNPRLRFEYLGLFPFHLVLPLLKSQKRDTFQQKKNQEPMQNVLMVAEKPSIALAIADALSGPRGHRKVRGISRALPVYHFTSTDFNPLKNSKNMTETKVKSSVTVTSVVGHIFSLGFDSHNQNDTQSNDPATYFHRPIVKQEEPTTSKLRVIDHLCALAGESDHLVLWLDCDPEGENIAHEVIAITRKAYSSKEGDARKRIHRARFSAISKKALKDAFADLQEPDANLSQSVDARQELDLRIGVALTRLLTWKCVGLARSKFSPATRLISYGPCQTPALSFCVERAIQIQQFKSETYWRVGIEATLPGSPNKRIPLIWKNPNECDVTKLGENATPQQETAKQLVKLASSKGSSFKVLDVQEKKESISAPLGLNTVALLEAGSKAMGMSPKQVMNVAEKLYSAGFISYPRTETTRYDPNGFDVRKVLRQHAKHETWGRSAAYLLRTKYSKTGRPPQRGKDVGDHPPITPLKAATKQTIGGGAAWRIYEFVVRNFIASLHNDLQFTRQTATLAIGDKNEHFKFNFESLVVKSLGFSDCMPWVLRDIGAVRGDSSNAVTLKVGQNLAVANANFQEAKTKPPKFLQEHELILEMDKNRIGTDASMAVHVSNIIDRGYVILCDESGVPLRPKLPPKPGRKQLPRQIGRYMVPTALGLGLIGLFGEESGSGCSTPALLAQPAIRGTMEEEVKQIALGELDKASCVKRNLDWFEARYSEFANLLSRDRTARFGRELRPTNISLKDWRRLGAFEATRGGRSASYNAVGTADKKKRFRNINNSKQIKNKNKDRKRNPTKK